MAITYLERASRTAPPPRSIPASMRATWHGRQIGTCGTPGCFSAQTFKHLDSGEGGLLVTDDEDVAAKLILPSGSYMLYAQRRTRTVCRPDSATCASRSA